MKLMTKRLFGPDCAAEFVDQRYTSFYLPGSYDVAQDAVQQFQKFLELPMAEKSRWDFRDADGKSDDGWMPRDGRNAPYVAIRGVIKKDQKDWFHWSPRMWDFMKQRGLCGLQQELVDACQACWEFHQHTWLDVLKVLDRTISGRQLHMLGKHPSSQNMCTLRLIVYRPVAYDEEMADWHPDRSDATFHVANSRPGLHIGPKEILWEPEPDDILFFSGLKAKRSMGVPELLHGVREVAQADRALIPRWTVVDFLHINHALYG